MSSISEKLLDEFQLLQLEWITSGRDDFSTGSRSMEGKGGNESIALIVVDTHTPVWLLLKKRSILKP